MWIYIFYLLVLLVWGISERNNKICLDKNFKNFKMIFIVYFERLFKVYMLYNFFLMILCCWSMDNLLKSIVCGNEKVKLGLKEIWYLFLIDDVKRKKRWMNGYIDYCKVFVF